MSVEGRWYISPGDIPAPYAFAVDLNPDGTMVWANSPERETRWEVRDGNLVLGGARSRLKFELAGSEAEHLSGMWDWDAAALMRDPGELEVR